MDMLLIVITAIICLLAGGFSGWFFAQTASKTRIAVFEAKFEAANGQLVEKSRELENSGKELNALGRLLQEAKIIIAGNEEKINSLSQSKTELAKLLANRETELISKNEELSSLAESKTTACTELAEARKKISEMAGEIAELENANVTMGKEISGIKETRATLEANAAALQTKIEEQKAFVEAAQENLKNAFGSLAADALHKNNDAFVKMAENKLGEKVTQARVEMDKKEQAIGQLVKPLSETLTKMDSKIHELETKREGAYEGIRTLLGTVGQKTSDLDKETRSLVNALKSSTTRGRYGELALRRIVEHAGMFEHCHFEEQVQTQDGKLRPDMIIKMPGKKSLVVDSKAPLAAYMRAFETENPEEQKLCFTQHVGAMKDHLKKLSAKTYWSQFEDAPDFVIMYIHIESSYGAALQQWPEMIEEAMKQRIIIATPTVLLSILLGIGYSWNQLTTMEGIEEIRTAAVELYDRSASLVEHLVNMGKSLNGTVNHYNKTVGSLESNFMPQGRRIKALSEAYSKKELPQIVPIETATRPVTVVAPTARNGNSRNDLFEEIIQLPDLVKAGGIA